jgi:hypothetical protein
LATPCHTYAHDKVLKANHEIKKTADHNAAVYQKQKQKYLKAIRHFKQCNALLKAESEEMKGEFQGQAEAKWMVIGGPLRAHNDTSCGWHTPGWPVGRPGVDRP